MSQVTPSSLDHLESISTLLVKHFEALNAEFSYSKYFTDIERMRRHVTKRISNPDSSKKYLSLEDDGEFLGFINYEIEEGEAELLVAILVEKANSVENMKLLVSAALEDIKSTGINVVEFECADRDDVYKEVLEKTGGRIEVFKGTIRL